MKIIKRMAGGALISAVLFFALGYGLAFAARDKCVSDTARAVMEQHIKGRDFSGTAVEVNAADVESRIRWPFVVDVYYGVPRDLHVTVHRDRYVVWPWKISKPLHTVYYLV